MIKSDTAISPELKAALRNAAAPLEDVPDKLKDWHPGSDGKVLDLVHPSLFPLLYGRSRILSSGTLELQDCTKSIGKGEVISVPNVSDFETKESWETDGGWDYTFSKLWSKAFQWLPCDVVFSGDDVKITSYINNLHPVSFADLYSVIEKLIAKSIPLWDMTLTSMNGASGGRKKRILHKRTEYDYPLGITPPEELGDDWDAREHWLKTNRVLRRPEPRDFESYQPPEDALISLREDFKEHGLQVIVKLANIELTPEKPAYDGESWHVEGQLNERICATALYYYDSQNIADSSLAFRHRTDDDEFEMKTYDQVFILPSATGQLFGLLAEPSRAFHRDPIADLA